MGQRRSLAEASRLRGACEFGLTLLLLLTLVVAACSAPTATDLLQDARRSLAEGDIGSAEIYLKNLLQADPNHGAGRALLGQVLLARGDAAGAEFNLRRAVDAGIDESTVQLPLLRSLLGQQKFASVVEQFGNGPVLTGQLQAAALTVVASAYRSLNAPAEAERSYRAALQIDPAPAVARIELADLLAQVGRVDEAREIAVALRTEQPDFAPAPVLLGALELSAGRFTEAEALFEEAMRLEADRRNGPVYTAALAQLVETHLAAGKLTEANASADTLLALNPQAAVGGYMKARVELRRGDSEAAAQRLTTLIAASPSFWSAHALLGATKASQGDFGQAESYLRTAVDNDPTNASARLLLAEVYLRQQNVDAARELLENLPAVGVRAGLFMALAGRVALAAGRPDLASTYFARSEREAPRTLRDVIGISSVYAAAGEWDRAIRIIESVETDGAESEQATDYLLAIVQLRRGDIAAATATAQSLAERAPDAAWPLMLRGTVAAAAADLAAARMFFIGALDREAEYVPALLSLARVAIAERKTDEAAAYLRRALTIDPTQLDAIFGLVQLAIGRNDFAEAQTWLANAPESAARFELEGELRTAERRFAEAASAFARAFELAPTSGSAVRAFVAAQRAGQPQPEALLLSWLERNPRDQLVNFALGSLELDRGDYDAAIQRFDVVLAVNPRHAAALNNLAWIYGERGDERALPLALRAREALPSDAAIADTLGWLYVRRGEPATGLPFLDEAIRRSPGDSEIRYHWAVALAETGDNVRAERALRALVSGDIDFPSRAQARERLEALRSGAAP